MMPDLTTQLFFRDGLYRIDPTSRAYAIQAIRHGTDEPSEFGIATREIRALPDDLDMMAELERARYELLIGKLGEKPIGHIGFQEHLEPEKVWKAFSVYVFDNLRGKGLSVGLTTGWISRGRELSVKKMRISKGGREDIRRIIERTAQNPSLNISINAPEGWIYIN